MSATVEAVQRASGHVGAGGGAGRGGGAAGPPADGARRRRHGRRHGHAVHAPPARARARPRVRARPRTSRAQVYIHRTHIMMHRIREMSNTSSARLTVTEGSSNINHIVYTSNKDTLQIACFFRDIKEL